MQLNIYKVVSKLGTEELVKGYIVVDKDTSTIIASEGAPSELGRGTVIPQSGISWGIGPFSAGSPYNSEVGQFDLSGGSYEVQTYYPAGGDVNNRQYETSSNLSFTLEAEINLA